MYGCRSILECYNPFSGVKLSIRSSSVILLSYFVNSVGDPYKNLKIRHF